MVLPSIVTDQGEKEGIPVVLMEAMAAGVPVISTSTGGIPELLSGGAGLMVPPGDPNALADAIHEVLTDRETWNRLSVAGRGRIRQEYHLPSIASELGRIFSQYSAGF